MRYKIFWLLLPFIGTHNVSEGQSFINGSFESWGITNSCEINVSPDSWTNYSNSCAELDEANFTICPSTIPTAASHGNIYARACAGPDWQGGEGVFQNVSGLISGQSYTVSFDYAGSNLYGGSDSVRWKIFVDDINLGQTPFFSSAKNFWSTYSLNFIATQQVHKIGFRAYFINPSVSGDGSAGIDNVRLVGLGIETGTKGQLANRGIEVYPQLMNDFVIVKKQGTDVFEITLYDTNSTERIREKFIGTTSLNVQHLSPGVYVCLVKCNDQIVGRQTLIKL